MSAAEDRKNAKSRAIARAALNLFSRKGFPLTSIEQIAEEAGIGKSTVYEYFPTKEALFEAAISAAAEGWIADLEAAGSETRDALVRLERIAALFIAYHDPATHPEQGLFVEVLSQTLRQGGVFAERPHVIRRIYRRVVGIIEDYLLEGVASGQFRPEIARDAKTIAIHFLAVMDGIQLHGMIAPDQVRVHDQVTFFLDRLKAALVQTAPSAP